MIIKLKSKLNSINLRNPIILAFGLPVITSLGSFLAAPREKCGRVVKVEDQVDEVEREEVEGSGEVESCDEVGRSENEKGILNNV